MVLPSTLPAKILLVDDSADGLLVRRVLLEEAGYRVEVAGDGEEGLKLFEPRKFAVIVTDYRMPGMNGADLIRRIRMLDANARVILLSGFVEPLGLTEANTGADVVIAKSANEAMHLIRAVRRLINRGTARKPPATQKKPLASVRASSV